jgi:hypothetical protein
MSNRTRRGWGNGGNNRHHHQQPQPRVADSIFSPDAHQASTDFTIAQLDTICEYSKQMKTLIENGQATQLPTYFRSVFLSHIRATERNVSQLAYLEHRKIEQAQQESAGSGSSSHANSTTRLPSAKQLVAQLSSDPRKLREVQDEIARAANAS